MSAERTTTSWLQPVETHGVRLELEVFESSQAASPPRPSLAHLHRGEHTALAAARLVASEDHTRLVTICGEPERRVTFALQGVTCSFDPNRAFTARGRSLTLDAPIALATQARQVLEAFAEHYLATLGDRPIIAVHNNSPGPPLSILSYVAGATDAATAEDVFVASIHAEDDFALVTTRSLFEGFRSQGFNVVLQSSRAPDDGSLSIRCAQEQIPYVNVEALEGHLDGQVRLIRVAGDLLSGAPAHSRIEPR